MKTEIKTINSNTRELVVTVDLETAQKDFQKVFNKVRKNLEMPGFRKGKVPVSYIEKNYMDYIKDEYFDKYAESYYKEALKESDVRPVSAGQIKEVQWNTGEDAIFTYTFQTFPEDFEPVYQNLEVPYKDPAYDMDGQIQKAIDELLLNNAQENPFDESNIFENKDIAVLEFFENDLMPVEYENNNHVRFIIGNKTYGEDLDEKIIGKKINDVFEAEFVDQENEIKNTYQFKVVDAFKVVVPELTEEFARSNDFESIEDMKAKLGEDFQKEYETVKNRELDMAIVNAVAKANPLDIPNEFFINNARYMFNRNYNLSADSIDEETLLKFGKMFSENQTIFDLVVEKIKKTENLEITEADKDEHILTLVKDHNQTIEEYKENYKHFIESENFTDQIMHNKVIKMIKETMTIVEPPVQLENQEEITEAEIVTE